MSDGPNERETGPGAMFPVEAVRHRYVTVLGGVAPDLQPWEVGIRRDALRRNTDLVPFRDRVVVQASDHRDHRPLLMRDLFTIVPLDERRPAALELSPQGEAVLSTVALDAHRSDHPLAEVPAGARLVLDATLSRRWRGLPEGWVAEVLRHAGGDSPST